MQAAGAGAAAAGPADVERDAFSGAVLQTTALSNPPDPHHITTFVFFLGNLTSVSSHAKRDPVAARPDRCSSKSTKVTERLNPFLPTHGAPFTCISQSTVTRRACVCSCITIIASVSGGEGAFAVTWAQCQR